MPKDSKKRTGREDSPIYTTVDCGVAQRGLTLLGYHDSRSAVRAARRHYLDELDRVTAALEALAGARFQLSYKQGNIPVSVEKARAVHAEQNPPIVGDAPLSA